MTHGRKIMACSVMRLANPHCVRDFARGACAPHKGGVASAESFPHIPRARVEGAAPPHASGRCPLAREFAGISQIFRRARSTQTSILQLSSSSGSINTRICKLFRNSISHLLSHLLALIVSSILHHGLQACCSHDRHGS